MAIIEVTPKEQLSIDAQDSYSTTGLSFAGEKINLNPKTTIEVSWFGRTVHAINSAKKASIALKIVDAIVRIALILSIVGIVAIVVWNKKAVSIDNKIKGAQFELDTNVSFLNKRAEMIKLFKNDEDFQKIPILDLKDKMGSTGYIDFLTAEDLTDPIMKGTDKFGRPFISFKIHDSQDPTAPFVFTLFQRYTDTQPNWTCGNSGLFNNKTRDRYDSLTKSHDSLRKLIAGEEVEGFKLYQNQ